MDIIKVRDSINAVMPRIPELLLQVLDENEAYIKQLIHIQLRKGQRGDGQVITPQYSEAYAKKKGRTIPDLKVSGGFWDSIFTEIESDYIAIDSGYQTRNGFELGQHLQKRYTEKIMELAPQSLEQLKKKSFLN